MLNIKRRLKRLEADTAPYIGDWVIDFAKPAGQQVNRIRRQRKPGETGAEIVIELDDLSNSTN